MLRVRQVKISLNPSDSELKTKIAHKLKIKEDEIIKFEIKKISLDARDKNAIHYVFEFDVKIKNEDRILKKNLKDVFKAESEEYIFNITGTE